jgi:hypothetical protein
MSVPIGTTWHYILEDGNIQTQRCENPKSYIENMKFAGFVALTAVVVGVLTPCSPLKVN